MKRRFIVLCWIVGGAGCQTSEAQSTNSDITPFVWEHLGKAIQGQNLAASIDPHSPIDETPAIAKDSSR